MTDTSDLALAPHADEPAIPFDNTYARLPDSFYERVSPAKVANPKLLRLNEPLAKRLGIDPDFLKSPAGIAVLSGNAVAAGSEPIALAYAGHQFGHFVPQLGDGRAVLLGEVVDAQGKRFDLQLKGSGRTRFSRQGDGRAVLGPVIREYIVSEAMAALAIPTTRSLAAVLTGETVMRERPLPGGVLTRVAASHLRIGTFQFFAARGDVEALRTLADYAIARHYPTAADSPDPYHAFFDAVVSALAELVARWMLIGFIHGVLNTDNTSIAGETIDYGPCAFMDAYDPNKVFSSIDSYGRYAFSNQPAVIKWNLARFAETLLPLMGPDTEKAAAEMTASLARFDERYLMAYEAGMRRKLGLTSKCEGDLTLAQDLLSRMAQNQADFTLTFRALCEASADKEAEAQLHCLFADPSSYDEWVGRWRARLALETCTPQERRDLMRQANPKFIPRNHRIEAAIRDAEDGRFDSFHELNDVLAKSCDDQPGLGHYAHPPTPEEEVLQTFCGT
jgi:serine/tyrosine/threonine adenylyltransferase